MLVLSRRTNETLVIDNNIRFTVLSVHGNQVRIGIEAPEEVIILREEIIRDREPGAADHRSSTAQPRAQSSATAVNRSSTAPATVERQPNSEHGNTDHHGKVGRHGVLGLRRRRP